MRKTLLLTTLLLAVNVQSFAQTCNDKMLASTPDDRFTVNNDGTVTDNETKLIWKQCLEGRSGADCSTGKAIFNWQEALKHAAAQGNNWRLPNIKELASIVELRCYDPAINLTIFPNTPPSWSAWSGSPYAYNSDYAWFMNFDYGDDSYNDCGYIFQVRLVRGGQ